MKKLISITVVLVILASFVLAVPVMAKESTKDPISMITLSLVDGVGKTLKMLFTGKV